MINWIWKYRDFVKAYDNCTTTDTWNDSYISYYLSPNMELLNEIHFRPKGFITEESIYKRINALGRDYFYKLRKKIDVAEEYERKIKSNAQSILCNYQNSDIELDLYVIIGMDCTNIYCTEYQGKTVTVLCLESVDGSLEKLNLLLSHESHHWVRDKFYKRRLFGHCVGQRVVTEGLAINCSEYLFPGYQIYEYSYVPEATANWVIKNWDRIDSYISEKRNMNDFQSGLFTRSTTSGLSTDEPPRIGYVYGYLKVKEYMRKNNRDPIELVDLDWQKVL